MTAFTIDDARAYLLDKACGECGTALPVPGGPCPACGVLPSVTGPELAEQLDGPSKLAVVAAAKLRTEARELQDALLAKHLEADRVEHLAVLEERRNRTQAELEVAVAQRREKTAPLKAAQRAEGKTLAALEQARTEHAGLARAEETARRMRAGVSAEAEAALRLRMGTDALARYEQEHSQAVAAREAAQRDLDAATGRVRLMEAARDTAAKAVADPGRIPVSLTTISADLLRLLAAEALDPVEVAMARVLAQWISGVTGHAEALEADTRRRTLEEAEQAERERPLVLQPGNGGRLSVAPNPLSSRVPRQRAAHGVGDGLGIVSIGLRGV
ncbi:MAG: hypothetical protein ACYCVZ_00670 [Streptosporangiaceae bacterium]